MLVFDDGVDLWLQVFEGGFVVDVVYFIFVVQVWNLVLDLFQIFLGVFGVDVVLFVGYGFLLYFVIIVLFVFVDCFIVCVVFVFQFVVVDGGGFFQLVGLFINQ